MMTAHTRHVVMCDGWLVSATASGYRYGHLTSDDVITYAAPADWNRGNRAGDYGAVFDAATRDAGTAPVWVAGTVDAPNGETWPAWRTDRVLPAMGNASVVITNGDGVYFDVAGYEWTVSDECERRRMSGHAATLHGAMCDAVASMAEWVRDAMAAEVMA